MSPEELNILVNFGFKLYVLLFLFLSVLFTKNLVNKRKEEKEFNEWQMKYNKFINKMSLRELKNYRWEDKQ